MSARPLELDGEAFVTVEVAAECYHVEVRWLEDVCARGYLCRLERIGGALALPVSELDRLAALLRWHRHHGLDLDTVVALFAD